MSASEQGPCDDCGFEETCDGWEAMFCCDLCRWNNGGETPSEWCDDCDPWDI